MKGANKELINLMAKLLKGSIDTQEYFKEADKIGYTEFEATKLFEIELQKL